VGTAYYDPLIKEMDRLVSEGRIRETVYAQIGRGKYIPKNMGYFRFIKSLDTAYSHADLIISTGGAGTTLECTKKALPLIVVENKTLMEGHQAQLITEMERRGHLVWCKRLEDLVDCIEDTKHRHFEPYIPVKPIIHNLIQKLIME
jgi:beta-1,4-N-acetylglucosaminyltransferase